MDSDLLHFMKLIRLRPAILAGVIAFGTGSGVTASSAVEVPLPEEEMPALSEIVKVALSRSPRTMARDFEVLNAQYQELISSARLFPQASGTYQLQFREEDRGGNTGRNSGDQHYYNFTVNQALWHWGAIRAASKIGKIGSAIAGHNLESTRREVAVEVRSAYLGLIVQKLGVRNSRHSEALAKESLALEEERFKAKETTAGVVANARLRADELSLAADRAALDLEFAVIAFRRLAGLERFSEADIPDRIVPPRAAPGPLDPRDSRGYLRAESLLVNELQIERTKLENLIDRKALWPRLNAIVGVSQDDSIFLASLDRRIQNKAAYVGFQATWTIFDGFASKGRRLQSRWRLKQLEDSREDLLASLQNSSDQHAANVGFTWRAYKNAETRLTFATGRLNTEKANLERGLSSGDLISQAQAGVNQAEFSASDALAKFYIASARFASTMRADPLIDGTNEN